MLPFQGEFGVLSLRVYIFFAAHNCDGVFKFLGIAPCPIPTGSKGKRKMKQLFRLLGPGSAYHEGMRAKELVAALDLDLIIKSAPLDFEKIEKACFFEME